MVQSCENFTNGTPYRSLIDDINSVSLNIESSYEQDRSNFDCGYYSCQELDTLASNSKLIFNLNVLFLSKHFDEFNVSSSY